MVVKEYMPVVAAILRSRPVTSVLDAPSGAGWLRERLDRNIVLDGIDLYETQPDGYRGFRAADLDHGLPGDLPTYDAVVSCEGLEHIANPEMFLRSAAARLNPGGTLVVTTPNTWHPAARLQYFTRAFFRASRHSQDGSKKARTCTSRLGHSRTFISISAWLDSKTLLCMMLTNLNRDEPTRSRLACLARRIAQAA